MGDLYHYYAETDQYEPPTAVLSTLKQWSARYGWVKRAESYDAELERQKNEYAAEVMHSGLAQAHERVVELKRLARFLLEEMYEQGEDGVYHNVWLPDVKQIGSGDYAERVDIERYNSPLVSDIRGVLDDLAKETGGRKQRQEISGPEGGPVNITVREVVVRLTDGESVEG